MTHVLHRHPPHHADSAPAPLASPAQPRQARALTARRFIAAILLIGGIGCSGFTLLQLIRLSEHEREYELLVQNPWRRTVRGWEHISEWSVPPKPVHPHPLVVAGWILAASIGCLYGCGPATKHPQYALTAGPAQDFGSNPNDPGRISVRNSPPQPTNIYRADDGGHDVGRQDTFEVANHAAYIADDAGLPG